jgi:D-aminoacyl-tRNA deacylase
MRVVLQRVASASVSVVGDITGEIERGLLVFVGIEESDSPAEGEWLARKLTALRIFPDESRLTNLSVKDVAGGILLVSQFTLHASTQKGSRPSFARAARPEVARPLYDQFIIQISAALGRPIATGIFGADMRVALVNDGPVTLIIDSKLRD